MVSGTTGAENMTFTGTQFVSGGGNTGYALNIPDAYGSTFNLDHVSIDYWGSNNASGCPSTIGTGQVLFNDGHLTVNGSHFESCSGPQIIASSMNTLISIDGGTEFSLVDSTHALSTPGIIEVTGNAPQVDIEPGTYVTVGAQQSVGAYVANSGTGGVVWIGPYYSVRGGYFEIPPVSGPWNSGLVPIMINGSVWGFNVIGNLQISGTMNTGGNIAVYSCAGSGALTVNPSSCSSPTDTGLRVK